MRCYDLLVYPPSNQIKGLGDEPVSEAVSRAACNQRSCCGAPQMLLADGATLIMHRGARFVKRKGIENYPVDQHASFPKGLPKAFVLQHIKD